MCVCFPWWFVELYRLFYNFAVFVFYGPLRVDVRVFGLAKASRHLGHGVPLVAPAAKAQGE